MGNLKGNGLISEHEQSTRPKSRSSTVRRTRPSRPTRSRSGKLGWMNAYPREVGESFGCMKLGAFYVERFLLDLGFLWRLGLELEIPLKIPFLSSFRF